MASDIVLKYIPIGSDFERAELILKSAGFKLGERKVGDKYYYANVWYSYDYHSEKKYWYISSISSFYIHLIPLDNSDLKIIKSVTISIVTPSL
jgi:hypothetical protein